MIVEITTKAGNRKKIELTSAEFQLLYKDAQWLGTPLAQVEVLQLAESEKAPHVIKFP